jgi:hypothetical protein
VPRADAVDVLVCDVVEGRAAGVELVLLLRATASVVAATVAAFLAMYICAMFCAPINGAGLPRFNMSWLVTAGVLVVVLGKSEGGQAEKADKTEYVAAHRNHILRPFGPLF